MQIPAITADGIRVHEQRYDPYGLNTVTSYPYVSYTQSGSASNTLKGNFKDPLPFEYSRDRKRYFKGTASEIELYQGYPWSQNYSGVLGGVISNPDGATILAQRTALVDSPLNKALDKLYSQIRADVDLSIDFYQSRQTASFVRAFASTIASPVATIGRIFRSAARDGRIRKTSSFASDAWLQWQYGVKPSMSTIYTMVKELDKRILHPTGFFQAKARSKNVYQDLLVDSTSWRGIPILHDLDISKRVEVAVVYGISDVQRNALSNLTSLNPVSFLYENIPYSFVLDWLIDIGGYLRNMETACISGLEFKSGYITYTTKAVNRTLCNGVSHQGAWTYIIDAKEVNESVRFSRSLLTQMPTPNLPSIDLNLGSSRLLSAAALLRGLLKR